MSILIGSAAGTVVRQGTRADVYHSLWFIVLLFLFGLNLLACTLKRVKLWRVKPGSSLTHLGLLVILSGALITGVFGEKGFLIVFKNYNQDTFVKRNGEFKELDFKIHLDDFSIQWDDTNDKGAQEKPRIKNFKSKITVIENNFPALSGIIEVNRPLTYKGYSFYQAGYDRQGFKWASLEVVKDPGAPFVFTGFIVLNAGVILSFYSGQKGKESNIIRKENSDESCSC